ncbi:MAG: S8 family serine peptidase [Saprospiraceae bacterium]
MHFQKGSTFEGLKENLQGGIDYFESKFKYHYNPDFNARTIVGDNYFNTYEKGYGNNDVEGPDAGHGTHVAGIIAASRGNGVGMDGVANSVRIMSVRAVPDGDERDKDVANAIIYAVDNGASVINMSFGKGYSWDKEAVDKAVKYAKKKDVLLIHAAGNDSENNDNTDNFPNDNYEKSGWFSPKKAKNWLEIGALSWKGGENSPATFSNYGKENVDLFAPGVDIYSTIPDQTYASFSGTSMASPVTAGVAAVIRSYYPELTAEQVKEVLMESVVPLEFDVMKPGTEEKVPFSDLSVTGGVVNVYKAVFLASKTKGKKKNWKDSPQYKAAGVMPSMPEDKVIKP